MPRPSLFPVNALIVAVSLCAGGCIWGDPGYGYSVRNESDEAVIVGFGGRSTAYLASPGEEGIAVFTLGIFEGDIEIFDNGCRRRQVLTPTSQLGAVVIQADGMGRFESIVDIPGARLPANHLHETSSCAETVQPPPDSAPPGAAVGPGMVVFSGGGTSGLDSELWTVRGDGTPPQRLAPDIEGVEEPAWSADGRFVAYDRFRTGDEVDLSVLDLSSGEESLVRKNAWDADWSPDGRLMVIVSGKPADEGGAILAIDRQSTVVSDLHVAGVDPTWSPDGKWIAYQVYGTGYIGNSHMWVVPSEGGRAREMTTPATLSLGLAWSPKSRSILATSGASPARVIEYRLDGSPPVAMTPGDLVAGNPAWSPDGSQIVFAGGPPSTSDVPVDSRLYVLDVVSGRTRQLTRPPEFVSDYAPSWSPDGTRVAFLRGGEPGLPTDLFAIRADGSGEFLLAQGVIQFAWRAAP